MWQARQLRKPGSAIHNTVPTKASTEATPIRRFGPSYTPFGRR